MLKSIIASSPRITLSGNLLLHPLPESLSPAIYYCIFPQNHSLRQSIIASSPRITLSGCRWLSLAKAREMVGANSAGGHLRAPAGMQVHLRSKSGVDRAPKAATALGAVEET
jgi:hypothetical protein